MVKHSKFKKVRHSTRYQIQVPIGTMYYIVTKYLVVKNKKVTGQFIWVAFIFSGQVTFTFQFVAFMYKLNYYYIIVFVLVNICCNDISLKIIKIMVG